MARITQSIVTRLLAWASPALAVVVVVALLIATGIVSRETAAQLGDSVQWFTQQLIFPALGALAAILVYRLAR